MDPNTLLLGLAWYLVFVVSTVLHEAAHAFTALKLGDRTAYEGGQVSLDPIPHIRREPFGMVLVPIISFVLNGGNWMIGYASAPYDPYWAIARPHRAALMALAGPVSNLLLVVFVGLLIRAGLAAEVFVPGRLHGFTDLVRSPDEGLWKGVALILSLFFNLNLVLFVFNLFPVPPLDGHAVIPLFLPKRVARKYVEFFMHQPMFALLGIIVAWNLFGEVFFPVYHVAIRALYVGSS